MMPLSSTPTSRREFLTRVGMAGGAAALYETMTALGLINVPKAWAGPLKLEPGSGKGQSVVILGAGIGGLTAAYELTKAGYECRILEAQDRAGGRSLTARRGTKIIENSQEHGTTEQECQFDEGLYLNMGPGRIPYHHRRVIHYCRELGVPLEVYVMETTANLFQSDNAFDGVAVPIGRIANDTRGHISELLAKAVSQSALDDTPDEDERRKLLNLLEVFGDLPKPAPDDPYEYRGSTRAGCREPVTVHKGCEPAEMLSLKDLLNSEFWQHHLFDPVSYLWQPTLFQPVGGMDQIVEGFKLQIDSLIIYGAEVREIDISDSGVEVRWHDRELESDISMSADYCISSIPMHFFKRIVGAGTPQATGSKSIVANFSDDFRRAVERVPYDPACKVGWQANQRFWESDDNKIYGGISWTEDVIAQIWYPSNDYFSDQGTLTGAYIHDADAESFGKLDLEKRLKDALTGARKLHSEFGNNNIVPFSLGLSIAWQNVAFQHGAWARWKNEDADRTAYKRLLSPDHRRFHVAGDQVSTLPGWQEGAMMSAEHVCGQIAGTVPLELEDIIQAPVTRDIVQGRI